MSEGVSCQPAGEGLAPRGVVTRKGQIYQTRSSTLLGIYTLSFCGISTLWTFHNLSSLPLFAMRDIDLALQVQH